MYEIEQAFLALNSIRIALKSHQSTASYIIAQALCISSEARQLPSFSEISLRAHHVVHVCPQLALTGS
jgi:hypothetical protein